MTDRISELELENHRLRARVAELENDALGPGLSAIASQIPDNLIVIDREYRIKFINWTVPDLTVEGVLGTEVLSYVPEHVRATVIDACEKAFATGENVNFCTEYFAGDGSISKWETRVLPLRGFNGRVERLLQINTNVTEREEASADLSRFFQLSVDMLCVASLAGHFKRVSPAFTAVLGWTAEELKARPFLDFVHPEDRGLTLAAVEELRRGQVISDFENRYLCKGGDHRVLEWRAIAEPQTGLIYAPGGSVTERRGLEENLRHARKMEAIGRLAGGLAHDFNNLILAMSLNAELARSTGAREPLDEIAAVAERAAQLTRQLLVFSRRETLTTRVVDLNHVVTNLVRILRRAIASSIRIDVDTSSQALLVRGDPSQLEQLLMNLCLNARDAMPDGGILSIRTERVASASRSPSAGWDAPRCSHARLTVSDTGAGIPPEIRDRIFEPFFTTKPPGSGTGLGLAAVYGVVEQHNGSVSAHSKPGHGACFEIDLPMHTEIGPIEVFRQREPARGGTETVLVAEDFAHVRRVVVSLLETAGYRVLSAAHGDEALRCIREHGDEIALALLDVMMPFKTGPEVAARAIQTHPKMRILFTSGYSEAAASLSSVPEERLLRKPYERDDLLRRIRRMLDEPSVTSASA